VLVKLIIVSSVCAHLTRNVNMENPKLSNGIKNTLRSTPAASSFEPFVGKKIDSSDFLDELEGRTKCPNCLRSRKFFCYTCYVPMPTVENRLPKIKVVAYTVII